MSIFKDTLYHRKKKASTPVANTSKNEIQRSLNNCKKTRSETII